MNFRRLSSERRKSFFMAKIKSLIIRSEIDEALKSHNCQHSAKHRIAKGEKRLKVRNGRSWDHYCLECAKSILQHDAQKIEELARVVETA
jgi:hypothetical protein